MNPHLPSGEIAASCGPLPTGICVTAPVELSMIAALADCWLATRIRPVLGAWAAADAAAAARMRSARIMWVGGWLRFDSLTRRIVGKTATDVRLVHDAHQL